MRYWVLGRDNQPKGPYADTFILQGLAQGKVDPSRLVCREGEQEWHAVRDVPELNGRPGPADVGGLPEMVDLASVQEPDVGLAPMPAARSGGTRGATAFASAGRSAIQMYDKAHRVSMINRRTAAYMIELLVAVVLCYLLAFGILLTQSGTLSKMAPDDAATVASFYVGVLYWIFIAIWHGLRDVIPGVAWCRWWLALGIVKSTTSGKPGVIARSGRTLLLLVPFMPIVEYFLAYNTSEGMLRLGDRMTGTCVIDLDPHGRGKRAHHLWLLGALVLWVSPCCIVPAILALASTSL